jgi:type I restriction enzyme S subunit
MQINWQLAPGWGTRKLGDIAPEDSRQIKPSDFPERDFNYWSLDAIGKGQFTEPPQNIVKGAEILSICNEFQPHHVLFSKLRPLLNKVITPSVSGIGSTEWVVLNPNPALVDRYFLAYVLRTTTFVNFAARSSTGARQPRVPKNVLWNADIPLPYPENPELSIATQRRIVARIEALLSEVREMRELNTQILTNTSTLRRSVVLNLFQDLESSQKDGWRRIKIDNDSVNIKSGFAFARRNMVPQGVPHLRPFNIDTKGEVIITDDTVTIPLDFRDDLDEFRLLPGDVLYNNTNSVELVGKSGIVRKPMAVAFSNHLNRIRVRDPETLDPRWLVLALRNLFETGFFAANCVKWIGQAGFSITRLAEVEILLPDFNTQQKAIAQIENAQSEIDEMEFYNKENSQLIADMEQAFLAQAFRGEL